ncbi:hypothetical protein [Micromonospora sp. NPDC005367]|uniref:hypothetical protein n=1 Tax=Micromonospora sp. NPDC005367 TaxID=3155590 RepID=UPI0033A096F9
MAAQGSASQLVLVTADGPQQRTTNSFGMDLVQEVARLLGSENIRSTRLGGDLTLWHAEDNPGRPRAGRPNPAASGLAAEYGAPPITGPAVITGPIMNNTIYPLDTDQAGRVTIRLRAGLGNRSPETAAPAAPADDCTRHSPCRELLAMPAAQRDSLLRLIPARSSDLGPDGIYVHLNDEVVALLVAMGPDESGRFQQAYPVLGHLTSRWNTSHADLIMRAIANMRRDDVVVEPYDQGEYSPLYVIADQGVSGVAQLVRLNELLGDDLPHGAIIGVPREHQIIAVPIRKARDLATIEPVLRLVHNVGSDALDRVSLDVHWFHQGRLHPLRAEMKNGQLEQIFPPDEFHQLIEQLPRD